MATNRFYFISMLTLVLILGYLTFLIIKPFLAPIAWAVVLSIVFYPLYLFVLRYVRWKSAASLIVLIVIILIILGPFSYISYLLVNELQELTTSVHNGQLESAKGILHHPAISSLLDRIASALDISLNEAELRRAVGDNLAKIGKELIGRIPGGLSNLASVLVDFIMMSFSIFFLLRDSSDFFRRGRDYLPFSEAQNEELAGKIKDIVVSTIYGGVVVAIVQGLIAGVTYAFLGTRSPALWGLTTAVASFVPVLGTSAVWGVIALYFLLTGMIGKAVILTLVGMFVIGMVDNVLKPLLIGARTHMHILIIFFSVLGGISLFGLIGLIMGPLVVALFFSTVEIFRNFEGGRHA